MALLACGIGKGDEVITPALSFVATAQRHRGAWAPRPGVRGREPRLAQHRSRAGSRPGDHTAQPAPVLAGAFWPGLPLDMERLYAIAGQHRPARHRGRRARDRLCLARGGASAASGTWWVFSFHPQTRTSPPSRVAQFSGGSPEELKAIELHRWHGSGEVRPPTGSTHCWPGGKYKPLRTVAAAVGPGTAQAASRNSNARRPCAGGRAYFELWACGSRRCACRSAGDAGHSWHGVCPAPAAGAAAHLAARVHRVHEGARHRCRGSTTRRSTLFQRLPRRSAIVRGSFPTPSASAARTVTLPLFPAMELHEVRALSCRR